MAGLYGVRCTVSYREGDRTYTCTTVLLCRTMPYVRCTEVYETYDRTPSHTQLTVIIPQPTAWNRRESRRSDLRAFRRPADDRARRYRALKEDDYGDLEKADA